VGNSYKKLRPASEWYHYKDYIPKECFSGVTKVRNKARAKVLGKDYYKLDKTEKTKAWRNYRAKIWRQICNKARDSDPLVKDVHQAALKRKQEGSGYSAKSQKILKQGFNDWAELIKDPKIKRFCEGFLGLDALSRPLLNPSMADFWFGSYRSLAERTDLADLIARKLEGRVKLVKVLEKVLTVEHPLALGEVVKFDGIDAAEELTDNREYVGKKYGVSSNTRLIFQLLNAKNSDGSHKFLNFIIYGGMRSGKTVAILMWLIDQCYSIPKTRVGVLVRTYKSAGSGAKQIFQDYMEDVGLWESNRWREQAKTYTFDNGSTVEFWSGDKIKGSAGVEKDYWFYNEADLLDYEFCLATLGRATKGTILDFNPRGKFRLYLDMLRNKDVYNLGILKELTYEGNEFLTETQIKQIEVLKINPDRWEIMGKGKFGDYRNMIYPDWQIIPTTIVKKREVHIPHGATFIAYGLDFGGYQNGESKMAMVGLYRFTDAYGNQQFLADEELYADYMPVDELVPFCKALKFPGQIICDAADQTAFEILQKAGLPVLKASKGSNSISPQIKYIQDQRISVTERSVNLIAERDEYYWKRDANGVILPVPAKSRDDLLDALRYVMYWTMARNSVNKTVYRQRQRYSIAGYK